MSWSSRWFKKSDPEDYEQILSSIASDIQKRETRLSEIRLRERRATLLVTLYTMSAWILYVSVWYTGILPGRRRGMEQAVKGVPVVLGPIVILFTRRIVQLWYARKGDAEEKTLKTARQKQRSKIEEIKKKTNYYSTRNLIERYDESTTVDSPVRRRVMAPPQSPTPQLPVTPQPRARVQNPPQNLNGAALQNQLSPTPQPLQTPRKQWYDKLADAILGDDEPSANVAASRFALICEKCFTHNGLVKESVWEDTQYVCPKCGHYNASARSKREALSNSPSPISSQVEKPSQRAVAANSSHSSSPHMPTNDHLSAQHPDHEGLNEQTSSNTSMDVDS